MRSGLFQEGRYKLTGTIEVTGLTGQIFIQTNGGAVGATVNTELSEGTNNLDFEFDIIGDGSTTTAGTTRLYWLSPIGASATSIVSSNLTWQVISADGTVSTWYDQSTTAGTPNANHAVQADAAKQPKIVDAGSLVTGGIDFDGSQHFETIGAGVLTNIQDTFTAFIGTRRNSSTNNFAVASTFPNRLYINPNSVIVGDPSANAAIGLINDIQALGTVQGSAGNYTVFKNGAETGTAYTDETGAGSFTLGSNDTYTANLDGKIAEFIIYDSDQTDNRTALEANIGEVYSIAGIPAYDDTVNGFVSTRYDQSGNANDATQATTTSQPKIVDAGALVTGGIDFDGVDDVLNFTGDGLDIFTNAGYGQSFNVATSRDVGTSSARILSVNTPTDPQARYLIGDSGAIAGRFRVGGRRLDADSFVSSTASAGHGNSETLLTGFLNWSDNDLFLYQNGTLVASNPTFQSQGLTPNTTSNATSGIGAGSFDGKIAEMVIYNSDQSANRVAIETNINDHYSIF